MTAWVWVWALVLLSATLLFAGLVIVVGIGGFSDVVAMFRRLDEQHESQDEHADKTGDGGADNADGDDGDDGADGAGAAEPAP